MNLFKALFFAMLLGSVLLGSVSLSQAEPLGTAITYQGELRQSGQPANGVYDFEVGLYSAASGGVPVDVLTLNDIAVDEGIFSVQLDFTAAPFEGEQAWLAIAVRPGDSSGGYTGLLPRQKLTAVPYALNAISVTMDAIDSAAIADGQVGSADVANNALTAQDLANNSVGAAELANNAVDSAAIVNGAVTSADVADDSLTAQDLASNSVGAAEIASNAVGTAEIIASQVQRRVAGTCASGTFLSGIAEDGEVICSVLPLGLTRTLDDTDFVGAYTSIAIRDSGLPVISYTDVSNTNLKLLDCSNVACSAGTARTLDSAGSVGLYTSIAIRDSGLPVISYYDSFNTNLKLYSCGDERCEN